MTSTLGDRAVAGQDEDSTETSTTREACRTPQSNTPEDSPEAESPTVPTMAFSIRKLSKLNFQICFYAWLKTHHHNQISKKPVHSKELGILVKENSYNSEECETPDGSPRIEFFGQPQAEAEARADLHEEEDVSLTKVSITKVPHEEEAIGARGGEARGPSISHIPAHAESREIELSTCPRPQSIQSESVSMIISPFRRLAADQHPPEVSQKGEALLNEDIAEKKGQEEESRKDEARLQEENMRKAAAVKIEEIENAEEAARAAAAKEGEDEIAGKKYTAAETAAAEKDAAAAKVVVLAINRMCVCVCVCACVCA